ncbi:hypothetical protein BC830DRAFT_1081522 [Chytriomyces sp. MP71]|nr:hypothetical protein BC830DRAFT_1081522 [Chytriomyces sp. MP71]
MFKIGLGLTVAGVVGVLSVTARKQAIPSDSLLAQNAAQWMKEFPAHVCPVDLFEIKIPRQLLRSSLTVTQFARAFAHSPVFSLERFMIKQAGLAKDVGVPASFAVGDRLAIWTIAKRNQDEILATWEVSGAPFAGSTYFRVIDESSEFPVTLQFGSCLKVPAEKSISPVAMTLHFFYSRALLASAAATLLVRCAMGSQFTLQRRRGPARLAGGVKLFEECTSKQGPKISVSEKLAPIRQPMFEDKAQAVKNGVGCGYGGRKGNAHPHLTV